jgi:gluconolactonase
MPPVVVARADSYLEGPVFGRDGNLYVSSLTAVLKIRDGRVETWLGDAKAGYNGHKILPGGEHLICEMNKRAVWRYSARGESLGPASIESEGHPLRAPNDITLDGHGGYYFTDPGGSRLEPIGTVHYAASGRTVTVAGGMRVPNGLVLSKDSRFLFVAETVPNRILRFPVLAPGKLGPAEVFAELPSRPGHEAAPDGLAIGPGGSLYVAQLGTSSVLILDEAGKLLNTLDTGLYDTSNLCFEGTRRRQLYVTGSVGRRRDTPGEVRRFDLG